MKFMRGKNKTLRPVKQVNGVISILLQREQRERERDRGSEINAKFATKHFSLSRARFDLYSLVYTKT